VTDRPNSRVHDLDALRGFALLGIFIVNITFMASGYPGSLATDPEFSSPLDDAVRTVSSVLVGMKFYVLFSFLFGYSFTLQMDAAAGAGRAFAPRMLRRIAGLFVLGVLHIVFFYGGDVLTTYAVACLVLFVVREVKDRTAVWTAVALYGVVLLGLLATALFVDESAFLASPAEAVANGERATQAMLGGWGDVIGHNIDGLSLLVVQAVSLQGPTALAMFLLGMVAGRRRWLANVRGDEPVLRLIQRVGFPVGIAGGVGYALLGGTGNALAAAVSVATAPLLTAAYVATLLRIMHNARMLTVGAALAPAGRLALTNYLAQGVVGVVIFTGIGFGLAGTFSPLATTGLAAAVFGGQLVVSAWWLRGFRYGPAEWILRWVTNGERPGLWSRAPGTL
jgi:uncharacterized protein